MKLIRAAEYVGGLLATLAAPDVSERFIVITLPVNALLQLKRQLAHISWLTRQVAGATWRVTGRKNTC